LSKQPINHTLNQPNHNKPNCLHAQPTNQTQVKDHAKVDRAIIGWESSIGAWARVEGHSVLGKDVTVKVRRAFG
jgi:UDP-3-O-[3-hydroxymyristoyl] glucosamine N-acyltransferase